MLVFAEQAEVLHDLWDIDNEFRLILLVDRVDSIYLQFEIFKKHLLEPLNHCLICDIKQDNDLIRLEKIRDQREAGWLDENFLG